MKENRNLAHEWLKRARSNLARAKAGRVGIEILYEDLVFDCQQAAEKSLKALLIRQDIAFPKTHSISLLLDILKDNGIIPGKPIVLSAKLTEYAVETRYPGDYCPVTRMEYQRALRQAAAVVAWVEKKMKEDRRVMT